MKNCILDAISARSSIRAYTDTPLTEEELSALKTAALASPTARNTQTQRYLFITNKAILSEIEQAYIEHVAASGDEAAKERLASRNNKILYDAPLFVIVAIDPKGSFTKVDAGIAAQTLALAAKSLGLDSVILGLPAVSFESKRGPELREKMKFPPELAFGIGIAIGHRAMDKVPHESDPTHVITSHGIIMMKPSRGETKE
jgi:nitroreductase